MTRHDCPCYEVRGSLSFSLSHAYVLQSQQGGNWSWPGNHNPRLLSFNFINTRDLISINLIICRHRKDSKSLVNSLCPVPHIPSSRFPPNIIMKTCTTIGCMHACSVRAAMNKACQDLVVASRKRKNGFTCREGRKKRVSRKTRLFFSHR